MKPVRELAVLLSVMLTQWLSEVTAAQTNVTFPDPNLEIAIRSALGKPTDPLTSSDLEGLTSLSACSLNITNLSGLEWATNLTALNLSGNAINDILPVQAMYRLTWLNLDRNRLRNLSPLVILTNLTTLSLGENLISDGGYLSGLTNLSGLWMYGNSITNLTFLQSLTRLGLLDIEDNRVTNLASLVTLTNLSSLALGRNPVIDYSALSNSTSLTNLSLREGSITNLTPIKELHRLASLNLYRNPVTDISPLAGLTNLDTLDLRFSPSTNLEQMLIGCKKLTSLYLGGCSITDVGFLENLTRLTSLDLGYNKISDLSPLIGLTNLSYLVLSGNSISDFTDLSVLTNLVNLELRGSSISNLTFISGLTRLSYADLAYNSIVDTSPLALLTNLCNLVLTGNSIGNHTGLSESTNLVNVWLGDNSISNVTFLQGLSQLRLLILNDNRIVDPSPLAILTNLTGLGLSKNPVTNQESLAGFTNLNSLWLDGNSISNLSFLPGLTVLKSLELPNNWIGDLAALGGLTNLVELIADYNRLYNITVLENLPCLSHVQLVGNPLEVRFGSNAATIQNLQSRGVELAYLPTNQPPSIWISTNWFIAANASSSMEFYISDDVTSYDQLLVTISSSNPRLISIENVLLSGAYLNRSLSVTPAVNQTGTAELTLTVYDAAGASATGFVKVSVLAPEPVSIPDPHLAAAIRLALNKPTGRLSNVDLLALTDLFVVDTNISDISGVVWATNLVSLYLSSNAVTNLSPLQHLRQLASFTLHDNNTANLSELSVLSNIVSLSLKGNSVSNLTFLQNLRRLTSLNLDNNKIGDLSPLTTLTNLNSLSVRQNLLANATPLLNLTQLTDVDVSLNLIDISLNSPAMTVIKTLEDRGVFVNYLPQRGPPTIEVRPTWFITQNTTSSLSFGVSDNGVYARQFGVTASSDTTNTIPNENVIIGKLPVEDWFLAVVPAMNQIGTATLTLTATNDAGLSADATIRVTVLIPLPLDDRLLEGANLTWSSGGDALWFGQVGVFHGGGSAAQSGSIQNDQESWMQAILEGPGILMFWWKASSESFWDWLEFSLDGFPESARISGEVDWEPRTVDIPRGTHLARWRYFKDLGYSAGSDTAWVDQVVFLRLSWLELVGRSTNGQCQLLLHPVVGKLYQLQASTNLTEWFPLAVVTATNTAMPFVDQSANTSLRFYRLQELSAHSVQLQNPRRNASEFQLEVQSLPGLRFVMQVSEDLVSWSGVDVVSNAFGTVQYADMQATNSAQRYYRALLLP